MTIHKVGKYLYASTQRFFEAKTEEDASGFRHVHWGTLDADKVFHPYPCFLDLSPEERQKFIFPDDWNLRELEPYSAASAGPVNPSVILAEQNALAEAQSRLYGGVWLLERIGEKLGVQEDLQIVFSYNQEIVDDILTIAMYAYLTNYQLDRLEEWQQIEKYPSERLLSEPVITELMKSITEQNRLDFIKCRCLRLAEDEPVLCIDVASKTGFGVKAADSAWETNKEGVNLPEALEAVVYTLSDHVPVYDKTYAGNPADPRTIDTILADLKGAGFTNVILLLDRGYSSLKDIDRFISSHTKMVACMKADSGFSLSKIKSLGRFDFVPDEFSYDEELDLYTRQFDIERSVHAADGSTVEADKLRLHLYFDPVRRVEILTRLDRRLRYVQNELDEIVTRAEWLTSEQAEALEEQADLFSLKWKSHKRPIEECSDESEAEQPRGPKKKCVARYQLIGYERDETAMTGAGKSAGFSALVTLGADFIANEAMNHYSLRREQETDNGQWETLFPGARERLLKAGSSLVQFVERMMSCYLRDQWRCNSELRKRFKSTLTMMDEMRRIRCLEYSEQPGVCLTPFRGKQLDVCRILGITVPEGGKPGT